MLIDFTVENFRSFRDAKKLSMVASSAPELPQNVVDVPEIGLRILKSAAIYGANASGKSNLLLAIQAVPSLMSIAYATPLLPGNLVRSEVPPFALDPVMKNKPTTFKVRFLLKADLYEYQLSVRDLQIKKEALIAYRSGRRQTLFRREVDKFDFGKIIKGKKQSLQEVASDGLPVLAAAKIIKHPQLAPLADWIWDNLNGGFSLSSHATSAKSEADPDFRLWATGRIRQADRTIQSYNIERLDDLVLRGNGHAVEPVPTAFFVHRGVRSTARIDLDKQSLGLKIYYAMLAPLYDALKRGNVVFFDEFHAIHPELAREIFELFHSPETNPRSAQLILATHDTSLLSTQLLRRDQIWFTEKDRFGATDLYSLQDFKGVDENTDFGKGYLRGRYGAIPFFGKLNPRLRRKALKKAKKRQSLEELQRPDSSLPPKKAILISLEDEQSSRLYLRRFKEELYSKRIVFADHQGSDPKSVVLAAKERNAKQDRMAEKGLDDPFDEVWVVFDTEGPQNQARQIAARNAIQQVRDLNGDPGKLKFRTAVSNPTFEYWFLHHFEYYVKNLPDGDFVIRL